MGHAGVTRGYEHTFTRQELSKCFSLRTYNKYSREELELQVGANASQLAEVQLPSYDSRERYGSVQVMR